MRNNISAIRKTIQTDFEHQCSPAARLKALALRFDRKSTVALKGVPRNCRWLYEEILLQLCYPRFDAAVTRGINHLLKCPFSVHPKTGKTVQISVVYVTSVDAPI